MDIYSVNSLRYLPASGESSRPDAAEVSAGIYQPPRVVSDSVRLSDLSLERARLLSDRLYERPGDADDAAGLPEEGSGMNSMRAGDIVAGLRNYRSFSGAGAESASLVNKYI